MWTIQGKIENSILNIRRTLCSLNVEFENTISPNTGALMMCFTMKLWLKFNDNTENIVVQHTHKYRYIHILNWWEMLMMRWESCTQQAVTIYWQFAFTFLVVIAHDRLSTLSSSFLSFFFSASHYLSPHPYQKKLEEIGQTTTPLSFLIVINKSINFIAREIYQMVRHCWLVNVPKRDRF